jgi:hypothetical protein
LVIGEEELTVPWANRYGIASVMFFSAQVEKSFLAITAICQYDVTVVEVF